VVSTSRRLELLHIDLFGPSRTVSLGVNYYGLVVVDDYSLFTWILFIVTKDEAYHAFKRFAKVVQNERNCCIFVIKSDHRGEFQNERFNHFVANLESSTTFQHQGLHSRIKWWRGRTDH